MKTYYDRRARAIFREHAACAVALESLADVTTRHDGTTPDETERACMLRWRPLILAGTVPPIDVARGADGSLTIKNGECRLSMARELGVESLPVRMHHHMVSVYRRGYGRTKQGARTLKVFASRVLSSAERAIILGDAKGEHVQAVEQIR